MAARLGPAPPSCDRVHDHGVRVGAWAIAIARSGISRVGSWAISIARRAIGPVGSSFITIARRGIGGYRWARGLNGRRADIRLLGDRGRRADIRLLGHW